MMSLESLLLAIAVGYLLGAVPVAALVSRSRGVDIFAAGTRWAGAANVFRQVGHKAGIIVFLGDFAKGALVIIIATRLGLEAHMLLLPAMLALVGHWRSVFTRFKGGDGILRLRLNWAVLLHQVIVGGLYPVCRFGVGVVVVQLFVFSVTHKMHHLLD